MRWTTTSEQHCPLQVVGSFLESTDEKSTAQAHVASITPHLHPQSKDLPRRTTLRQQRQFKKEKKEKKQPFLSPSNAKLNGARSRSILGGHPIADSVPGYYGQRITRKDLCDRAPKFVSRATFKIWIDGIASSMRIDVYWPPPGFNVVWV